MEKLQFILILSLFFAEGCKKNDLPIKDNLMPMDTVPAKNIRYLALGDSYTIGQGVNPSETYPAILSERLQRYNLRIDQPQIIAVTGWTTTSLKNGIANANLTNKEYDIVSLLIGVNDYYQGISIEEYKIRFKELLLMSVDFARGNKNKVLVISIPDYGYTPYGESSKATISEGINLFNAANKHITDSMGIKYVDITPISRKGLSEPTLICSDRLHPSGLMYSEWVNLMINDIVPMINNP